MKLEDKIILALIFPVIVQAGIMVGITFYGFGQNHWKANYILGWTKCEYTGKAI